MCTLKLKAEGRPGGQQSTVDLRLGTHGSEAAHETHRSTRPAPETTPTPFT
eukprot:COSAG01_NODE_38080_length_494_cov_1.764557_1_plen_50_part_01